jgi:hypothetical protein
MFTFDQQLSPLPEPLSMEDKYGAAIALYERLAFHEIPVQIFSTTQGEALPVVVVVGDTQFGPNGRLPYDMTLSVELDAQRARNAATWKSVKEEPLEQAVKWHHQRLNLAIDITLDKAPTGDFEQRLDILKSAGFDIHTFYYHETEKTNSRALIKDGFSIDRSGSAAASRDPETPRGMFLKSHRDALDVARDPVQLPFLLRIGKTLTVHDRNEMRAHFITYDHIQSQLSTFEKTDKQYAEQSDEIISRLTDDPKNPDIKVEFDELMHEWKFTLMGMATLIRQDMQETLLTEGYQYLHMLNDVGGFGRTTDTLISLEPKVDIAPAGLGQVLRTALTVDMPQRRERLSAPDMPAPLITPDTHFLRRKM